MDGPMTLRIRTPEGTAAEVSCDNVRFFLRDGADGTGGGFVGIQRGHAPAVLALGDGPIRASLGGRSVLRAHVGSGFASVQEDVITVLTDSAAIEE